MTYDVPPALVRMTQERRLIPFVGSGLSASVGLPTWAEMLGAVCDVVDDGPTYQEISTSCNGNLLQMAEYLYISSGGHIGPLRQRMGELLRTSDIDTTSSGPHVELINLGTPHVYTTNYDDLVERTYRALDVPCEVVALPRHLASANGFAKPQVVKFHGDLRYENTLILTESSYYDRLDLDSPMDLKFRSDLLGRSVLFLGYSFNDINIRIIWHKLMEMMRDVPDADRPVSWIVKFASDPVQEELNRAAGIRTIVLNHDRRFGEESSPTERLEAFLLDLSILASDASLIPGSMVRRQFISEALLHSIEFATTSASGNLRGQAARTLALRQLIQAMSERALPPRLAERAGDILYLLVGLRLDNQGTIEAVVDAATNIARQGFYPSGVGGVFLRALTREGPRSTLLAHLQAWSESDAPFDWPQVYRGPHPTALLGNLHRTLKFEIDAHDPLSANSFSAPDVDLFYCFDIALRVIRGEVRPADPLPSQMRRDFRSSIKRIKALYPSLEAYDPPRGHGPDIEMARRFQEILPPQPDPLEFDWEQADLTN